MAFALRSLIILIVIAANSYAAPRDQERGRAHFMAGSTYYDQKQFAAALREFNEAYLLSQKAELLYNIAVCDEHLGHWEDAVVALKGYLAEKPDAADRAQIQARIDEYEQRLHPTEPGAESEPFVRRHLASTIAASVAAASLVTLIGTGAGAIGTHDQLDSSCANRVCAANLRDERDRGQALAITSDVLLGVGLTATAVAVALFVLEWKHPFYGAATRASRTPNASGFSVSF